MLSHGRFGNFHFRHKSPDACWGVLVTLDDPCYFLGDLTQLSRSHSQLKGCFLGKSPETFDTPILQTIGTPCARDAECPAAETQFIPRNRRQTHSLSVWEGSERLEQPQEVPRLGQMRNSLRSDLTSLGFKAMFQRPIEV
jgi:hypothetical protein